MNSIGSTIKCLRKAMGVTQEKMASELGVTYQAVSKWENDITQPDIMLIPAIASYFGVTIDELFCYKLDVMTNKERLLAFMKKNKILCEGDFTLKHRRKTEYYINTEQFTTNAQIAKIGEVFADCIRENNLQFDSIVGLSYHGIAFSVSTVIALYNKYGITTQYCFDRRVPDSRGRELCGYTLQDGERILIIDDVMTTGNSVSERIDKIRENADVSVEAVIVVVNRNSQEDGKSGESRMRENYNARVYSLLTDKDIEMIGGKV